MSTTALPRRARIYSVDVLRGIIMIIMALDHVRDFFHRTAMTADPLDPATTNPALYFTRWVTHFCAPLFVLLSGLSVCLMLERKTRGQISRFLLSRGLWLILLEVTVISFALTLNPFLNVMMLQVIWAIGISFLFLSVLVFLPWQAILAIGLLIVFGHDLLDFVQARPDFTPAPLWEFAHQTRYTFYQIFPGHGVIVIYPFLPWVGIMLTGFGLGRAFHQDVSPARRKRILVSGGVALIALFIILRLINVYGDPRPWSGSFYSFMNVNKYPPSLLYSCITIGPGLLALAALEHMRGKWTEVARVYGSVPFFYYVLHFYLIRVFSLIVFYASGYGAKDIVNANVPFNFRPPEFGYPLLVVYLIWILVVVLLYRPCKWYSAYKRENVAQKPWLSYL
ncbi:DUF1624 domain-containing protein [Chitinophaga lutea]